MGTWRTDSLKCTTRSRPGAPTGKTSTAGTDLATTTLSARQRPAQHQLQTAGTLQTATSSATATSLTRTTAVSTGIASRVSANTTSALTMTMGSPRCMTRFTEAVTT